MSAKSFLKVAAFWVVASAVYFGLFSLAMDAMEWEMRQRERQTAESIRLAVEIVNANPWLGLWITP